jgi:predicted HicB family RNase H-like nuclease
MYMDEQKLREKLKQRTLDTQLSLRINGEQLSWLQAYAKELNVSVNRLIIAILEQFQQESQK